MRQATITEHDADRIQPLHEVMDADKLAELTASMSSHGWQGASVVVIAGADHGWGPTDPCAVTGSHRIAAARAAGIDVPTVELDDLLREHGTTLDEMCAEHCDGADDETHYEALRQLDTVLPAEVIEFYGLDAH